MSGAHVGHSTSGTPKLRGDWGIVVGWPWTPLSISATGMNFKMTISLASCTMPEGQETEEKVAGPTPLGFAHVEFGYLPDCFVKLWAWFR